MLRQAGASYLDILAAGGGILSTVERTRAASPEQLHAHGRRWLDEMLSHGVTTAEVKTGYGLDLDTELRCLEVDARLDREGPVELVPTYLGAHAVPRELRGRPDAVEAHLPDIIERQLPRVAAQGIAPLLRRLLRAGRVRRRPVPAGADRGGRRVAPRLHADEIPMTPWVPRSPRSWAPPPPTTSRRSPRTASKRSGARRTPGPRSWPRCCPPPRSTSWRPLRPGAPLIERGVPVALGTDFNPGTSPTPNLQLVLSLACLAMKLSPAEALAAVTINAANAVGVADEVGSIEPDKAADLVIWRATTVEQLPYWVERIWPTW